MHYADKINWKLTLNAHKGSGGIINLSSLQHEAQAEQINRLCPAQQLPPAQHADTEEKDVFGPAYIPSARQTNSPELPLYTANAVLQTPESDKPISQKSADNEPSQAEQAQLAKLQQRDAKVKAHEQAHVRAAGGQAGTPTYTYQTGPDGQKYAIGGSVNISIISNGDDESGLRQANDTR